MTATTHGMEPPAPNAKLLACVKTAALNHGDAAHPGDEPALHDLGDCPDEATRI